MSAPEVVHSNVMDAIAADRECVRYKYGNSHLSPLRWQVFLVEAIGAVAGQADHYTDTRNLFHWRLRNYLVRVAAIAAEAAAWLDAEKERAA